MLPSDSKTGSINAREAGQAQAAWLDWIIGSLDRFKDGLYNKRGIQNAKNIYIRQIVWWKICWIKRLDRLCSCLHLFAEVAHGEAGMVFEPYTNKWVQWPTKVVVVGLRANSVDSFPQSRFKGKTMIHHDLCRLLYFQSLNGTDVFCFGCINLGSSIAGLLLLMFWLEVVGPSLVVEFIQGKQRPRAKGAKWVGAVASGLTSRKVYLGLNCLLLFGWMSCED